MRFALVLAALTAASCTPSSGDCAKPDDCAAPDPAPCEKCAALATSTCVKGICAARAADAVDVSATLTVERHVAEAVKGFAFVVAVADRACADVGSFTAFPADINALSSGQKTLEGGSVYPDLQLGRAPAGDVLVLGIGTDAAAADGTVNASGCIVGAAGSLALTIAP